ncbi:hypothetical protein [uncultured Nostoc sp.]|uniref:hypothetical protein n=1 Tax=uncultured Nostoc sp. TaxID=340711 RepID=UPI0035CA046E
MLGYPALSPNSWRGFSTRGYANANGSTFLKRHLLLLSETLREQAGVPVQCSGSPTYANLFFWLNPSVLGFRGCLKSGWL